VADMVEIKPSDRLATTDDRGVAMPPAEPQEIIRHGFGQEPEVVAIGIDAKRAVAFAELGTVRPVDEWDVGVGRLWPAHRADDHQLAEGVVEMVVTADDVGDA